MLAAREAFESHGELPEEGDLDFVKGNRMTSHLADTITNLVSKCGIDIHRYLPY